MGEGAGAAGSVYAVTSLKVEEEKPGHWLQISFLCPLNDITTEDRDRRNHSLPALSPFTDEQIEEKGITGEERFCSKTANHQCQSLVSPPTLPAVIWGWICRVWAGSGGMFNRSLQETFSDHSTSCCAPNVRAAFWGMPSSGKVLSRTPSVGPQGHCT